MVRMDLLPMSVSMLTFPESSIFRLFPFLPPSGKMALRLYLLELRTKIQ